MDKQIEDRFWARVDKSAGEDSCWIWKTNEQYNVKRHTGKVQRNKYGSFSINSRQIGAHRVAYELVNGFIPSGMLVCHHCDNPPCVNPRHLFLGTHTDNTRDCINKGRCQRDAHKGKMR